MSTPAILSHHVRQVGFRFVGVLVIALFLLLVAQHAAPVSAQTITPQHSTMGAPQVLEILSFKAVAKKRGVKLSWVTADEMNIMGFHIWRSTNKGPYVRLDDTLIAALSPGELAGNAYGMKDATVKHNRKYHYELEVVNANGTSSFSDPVLVVSK